MIGAVLKLIIFTCMVNRIINTSRNERDRHCGLVVRVSGYSYRGPGFDPRRYQIF